jgi:hypothetical protein
MRLQCLTHAINVYVYLSSILQAMDVMISVAELHHFYAAPAPGKNFDVTPAAPAPTLLYSKQCCGAASFLSGSGSG